MCNQVISRLQPDGRFDSRNRYNIQGIRESIRGVLAAAFVVEPADVARIDTTLQRTLLRPVNEWEVGAGDFARYWSNRDALLAGTRLDLMTLH